MLLGYEAGCAVIIKTDIHQTLRTGRLWSQGNSLLQNGLIFTNDLEDLLYDHREHLT